jgi:hypothetical protein
MVKGRDTGLLLFVEEPAATVARWRAAEVPAAAAAEIVAAVHGDLLTNLAAARSVKLYLTPVAESDVTYVAGLVRQGLAEALDVPWAAPLQRWDSGLSILHNRCSHRKILCADGRVPDVYSDDLARARRKLDLYEMILGREGQDRCWLIGMNGYQEVLQAAEVRPDDTLHPLLEAASRLGCKTSLLDTKQALAEGMDVARLQGLARRPQHPGLRAALARAGMAPVPASP